MSEPTITISHNFKEDTLEVRTVKGGVPMICSIPRHLTNDTESIHKMMLQSGFSEYEAMHLLRSPLRAGAANNDINTLYTTDHRYRVGYNQGQYQNTYKVRNSFPRSEQDKDAIMIRRVNARLRLKQERRWRHLRVAGIAVAAGWLFPVLCAIIARTWTACLFWIAS